ncbi:hypothetical protein GCM10009530_06900 [Microbispora corallina]|uniref:FXSXX-COOH protein n=1 Tax=Microbispora corallina TaxID=83302 RepID=A0ABQ4FV00_9ACTN|nr:hypothetical protein Mco01_16530 [Microbispora corallina]
MTINRTMKNATQRAPNAVPTNSASRPLMERFSSLTVNPRSHGVLRDQNKPDPTAGDAVSHIHAIS